MTALGMSCGFFDFSGYIRKTYIPEIHPYAYSSTSAYTFHYARILRHKRLYRILVPVSKSNYSNKRKGSYNNYRKECTQFPTSCIPNRFMIVKTATSIIFRQKAWKTVSSTKYERYPIESTIYTALPHKMKSRAEMHL